MRRRVPYSGRGSNIPYKIQENETPYFSKKEMEDGLNLWESERGRKIPNDRFDRLYRSICKYLFSGK
jgi:hypothetical protein